MGRLSVDDIRQEIEAKGYKLIDAKDYVNMYSPILIECKNHHLIKVSLADFRLASFSCPQCEKSISFINPTAVPQKKGYRVIAFDQATEHFGLSIFDNGELVFFNLYTFTGTVVNRLTQINNFINNIIIQEWKPDYVVCEDIQYQYGAVLTFKILAMLLGIIEVACFQNKISYEVVSPNVWRKYAGTCGKTRAQEKQLSVALVKEKYNLKVNDDVAEAILIGRYGAKIHKAEIKYGFGNIK